MATGQRDQSNEVRGRKATENLQNDPDTGTQGQGESQQQQNDQPERTYCEMISLPHAKI